MLLSVVLLAASLWSSSSTVAQGPAPGNPGAGQSFTQLPDGRLLRLGGVDTSGQPLASATFIAPTGAEIPASWTLTEPRAYHTATVMPDGRVLVFGGESIGRLAATAELIDPDSGVVRSRSVPAAYRRSRHTATLVTDGSVVLIGGVAANGALADAVSWDVDTQTRSAWSVAPDHRRYSHTARLDASDDIIVDGGLDASNTPVPAAERYSLLTKTLISPPGASDLDDVVVAESRPAADATDVPVDTRITLRFGHLIAPWTVDASTVLLRGPDGVVSLRLVPAEGGRLLFVTPTQPLEPGSRYELILSGVRDAGDNLIAPAPIAFTTAGDTPEANGSPDEDNGTEAQDSQWRKLPPLRAPAGSTALAGQVLMLNGRPLSNVTLSVDSATTHTDRTGRFLLTSLTSGHHELVIEGGSANRRGATYGRFEAGIDLLANVTSVLPYTIWMTRLDTAHAVTIASPTIAETVITTPRLPGLELRLPAGTVITDDEGHTVTTLSITPIPVNQPPFPLPAVQVPIYFTIQPGGAYLRMPRGMKGRLIYPNSAGQPIGTSFDFWNYDPEGRGWYVYGQGAVVPPGQQIAPNPGVGIYSFTGAMVASPDFAPATGPCACRTSKGSLTMDSSEVDPSTGLMIEDALDAAIPDVIPLELTRTYRPNDARSRAFGVGASHTYDMFLVGDIHPYTYAEVVLPDGARVRYQRISPGTGFEDAVYEHTTTPTRFFKSRLSYVTNLAALGFHHDGSPFVGGWELRLKDGTRYYLLDSENASGPAKAGMVGMLDRFGNRLLVLRDNTTGRVTQITTPNGRWVKFAYDQFIVNRVTSLVDNIGRTTTYTYDTSGRLIRVSDQDGGLREYTYDSSDRMLTVKDRRRNTAITNTYDAAGRVTQQTHADGTAHQYAYTIDINGKVTQTDVTDALGRVLRLQFNADGYITSDTRALGWPEQQTSTYVRQTGSNLITSTTDPLLRQTISTYDELGNLASVQRLAGTPNAVNRAYTYEPIFSELVTATDALSHTTTFSWNTNGSLNHVTDPLNHQTSFTYDDAGLLQSRTGPGGGTSHFAYSQGLQTSTSDPLGRLVVRAFDAAGRTILTRDALGPSTRFEYDQLDRLIRTTDALGGQTTVTLDQNSNMTLLTTANGGTTYSVFNSMNRMTATTDPLQRSESYAYDSVGNLQQITDRKGQVTTYAYDHLDRLVLVTYADTSTTAYTYDAGDHVTGIADSAAGTIARTYDLLDRLTMEIGPTGTVSYTFDAEDRRTSMTIAGQPLVTYTYDDDSRPLTISRESTLVQFAYDAADRRTSLVLPNGIAVTSTYDSASQVTEMTYQRAGTTLGQLTYQYDGNGNRTDVGGNYARVGVPSARSLAGYDAANELTTSAGTLFTYDDSGNLINDGARTFAWNARNQLVGISGGATASFSYDGLGRRIGKTVAGITTNFLYDRFNAVQEQSIDGTPTANLLTGLRLDETFSRTDALGTNMLLSDVLGSTLEVSDADGILQTHYSYEPFGATTASGAASMNADQFTGRENDGTGMYFNRARYYDPSIGRFISEDPIGFAGSAANFYAYVNNGPTSFIDPFGLTSLMYIISTGQLIVAPEQAGRGEYIMNASSGNKGCLNNSQCADQSNTGPIPPGLYNLKVSEISQPKKLGAIARYARSLEDWGSFRVPLTPGPSTNTFGRSGFYLHGGRWPGSAGCIDAGGGLFGDDMTNRLLQDLRADPDGNVPLRVYK